MENTNNDLFNQYDVEQGLCTQQEYEAGLEEVDVKASLLDCEG